MWDSQLNSYLATAETLDIKYVFFLKKIRFLKHF